MKNRTAALTLAALVTLAVAHDVRAAAQERSLSATTKGGSVAFLVGTAGPLRLLLSAAAILVVCTLLARVVSRVARRAEPQEVAAASEKP